MKDITQIMQMLHKDTDEYVDPDMFGFSARPKSNPPPDSKHHLISRKVLTYMTTKMFGFGRYVPQQTQPNSPPTREQIWWREQMIIYHSASSDHLTVTVLTVTLVWALPPLYV